MRTSLFRKKKCNCFEGRADKGSSTSREDGDNENKKKRIHDALLS